MIRILALIICTFTLTCLACKTKAPIPTTAFICNLDDTELVLSENCQQKMDCSFIFKNNGRIKTTYYEEILNAASIEAGDQLVFAMNRNYQDNPMIADDEFSEKLLFSIPAGQTSFYMKDDDLKKGEMVFATLAYSRDSGFYPVLEGCMEGQLQADNRWLIQGKITITTRTKRKLIKTIRAHYQSS